MAFTTGFWVGGLVGTADRMNNCLLGWGLYSEFPAATADNKGAMALATDRNMVYSSSGADWVQTAIAPPASLVRGDVIYFNGTTWARLPAGTAGQVLTTQGTGANPTWTTPAQNITAAMTYYSSSPLDTDYQNQSGKLMMVTYHVRMQVGTGSSGTVTFYVDPSTSHSNSVGTVSLSNPSGAGGTMVIGGTCTFLVLPGYYFRGNLSLSSGNLMTNSRTEWVIG